MKKLVVTLALIASSKLVALPIGNPADPYQLSNGWLLWSGLHVTGFITPIRNTCEPCEFTAGWVQEQYPDGPPPIELGGFNLLSLRIGFYGDYVFNRHMKVAHGPKKDSRIEHTQLFTNAGLLVVNLMERFDFFATAGVTNFYIDSNPENFDLPFFNGDSFLESNSAFSWSFGIRSLLLQCGCTTIGFEAQRFHSRLNIRDITFSKIIVAYPDSSLTADYLEWQGGLAISHRIHNFVPYVGIKCSYATIDLGDQVYVFNGTNDEFPGFLPKLRSEKIFGYAVGVTFLSHEKASLTVEGRWLDEVALYVNAQLRF